MRLFGNKKKDIVIKKLYHVSGLGLVQGAECQVTLTDSQLIIVCGERKLVLDYDQLIKTDWTYDTKTEYEAKSSTLGTIVGAKMYGIPGAIVGAMPVIKEKKEHTGHVKISYFTSGGVLKEIVLKDKDGWVNKAPKLDRKIFERAFPEEYKEAIKNANKRGWGCVRFLLYLFIIEIIVIAFAIIALNNGWIGK